MFIITSEQPLIVTREEAIEIARERKGHVYVARVIAEIEHTDLNTKQGVLAYLRKVAEMYPEMADVFEDCIDDIENNNGNSEAYYGS